MSRRKVIRIFCKGKNPTDVGTEFDKGAGITIQLEDMWAKTQPRQSQETHSKVCGIVAQQLLRYMLPKDTLKLLAHLLHLALHQLFCFVGYLASSHDNGKLSPNNQAADEAMRQKMLAEGIRLMSRGLGSYPRHEKNTAAIMERIWKADGMEKRTARFLAAVLGAHHQGKTGEQDIVLDAWKDWQDELDRRLRQYFYGDTAVVWPVIAREDKGAVGALLLGITILSDWISSAALFADADNWKDNLREAVEERMQAFLRDSGLEKQTLFPVSDFPSVWPNIPRQGMRPLQQETEALFTDCDEKISLVLLEAPMGEGKTEAGMYAALQMAKQWEKAGFYVALPTAATSNQMVRRMRDLLKMHHAEEEVCLLHAMAWLVDEQQPDPEEIQTEDENFARQWLAPLRRGLLSPYAVGTVDQAMQSVMMIKYGVLRLFSLSGKALVIDELHAYDVYMDSILTCLMQWCKALEIPVVLLSATLPPAKKQQMLAPFTNAPLSSCYPAVTAVTESGRLIERHFDKTVMRRRLGVKLCAILHEPERIAAKALELVGNGGCLCVMLNTVAQAQQVYRELKKQNTSQVLLLFHARFPAGRRDEIETQCLRLFGKDKSHRPKKAIVVTTQIGELSLDLDWDVMMTAIAPVDLLLQRAGREQRHLDTLRPAHFKQPILYVLVPKDKPAVSLEQKYGEDGAVYPLCLLAQSEYLLADRQEIRIPEDMAQLVADGYDESKAPADIRAAWEKQRVKDTIQAQSGDDMTLDDPQKGFRPASEQLRFDDLERDSFLFAKTRLGEPSVRIALLEAELYARVRQCAVWEKETLCAPMRDKALARAVLKQSVSIRKKLLQAYPSDSSVIQGRKLLDMVRIYPAEGGCYTAPDGKQIVFDRELGVLLKDGER